MDLEADKKSKINILGRRVEMFRCVVDPMIGPKPRQAFMPKDSDMDAFFLGNGIYVKTKDGTEHFVFQNNLQMCRLAPEKK